MADTGGFRSRELQAVALVIVPAAQVGGIALPAALGHAEHVDEKSVALVELRREQFDMAEMGDIGDGLFGHLTLVRCNAVRNRAILPVASLFGAASGIAGSSP